jgi:hypothetical protein
VINSWKAPDSEYRLWILERPPVTFSRMELETKDKKVESKKNVPKWEDWEQLWKLWDQ